MAEDAEKKESPAAAPAPKKTIRLKPAQTAKPPVTSGLNPGAAPAPPSPITPPPGLPGVNGKQTIRLRSSSTQKPAADTVPTDTSRLSRQTIKLIRPLSQAAAPPGAPLQSGAPSPSAKTLHLESAGPAAAPSAPTLHLDGNTQPSPSSVKTLRLPGNVSPAAGKTLDLGKVGAGQPLHIRKTAAAEPANLPESLQKPLELQEIESPGEQDEMGVAFLISSIVALIAVIFLAFATFAQYSNFFSGSDINVPGLERLSSSRK